MKSYLWNGELELGLPFGGKAQLCTQEVSQGKYWTQAMSKKATQCLQQQTASFAATMWHSKVGSLQTHWTSTGANATAQLHSPQPSLVPPPQASPGFLLAGTWACRNGLGISCHCQVRTGLLPTGTEHKLGFKVSKPLIAAVTRLLKPVYIIVLDKILYVLDEK